MYERPYITVNNVREILGISFPNANNLIGKFVSNGLLTKTTDRARNRVFMYSSYVNLFSNIPD